MFRPSGLCQLKVVWSFIFSICSLLQVVSIFLIDHFRSICVLNDCDMFEVGIVEGAQNLEMVKKVRFKRNKIFTLTFS